MKTKLLRIAAVLALLSPVSLGAQEHPNIAKGMGATATLGQTDIDSINYFNGNLVIRLPLGQSYPVNAGLSYQLSLVYNSQAWEVRTYDGGADSIPSRHSNAGLGWSLQVGRLNPPSLDLNGTGPDYNRNTYVAPDGSSHTFFPTLHEGEAATAGVEYTRDGSYLRLKTATRQIEFPDGAVHTFNALNDGYLTRMEDRFGNFVQVDYFNCAASCVGVAPSVANRWRITDTQGRTHWIHLKNTGLQIQPWVVTRVDLQAFGGARAVYKLLYNDSTDDDSTNGTPVAITGCGASVGAGDQTTWLLTRLVLPDGSVYETPKAFYFGNSPAGGGAPCKTGLLSRVRLPTLGQIEWDYILYKFPSASSSRALWQRSTGVGVRRLLNAASVSIGQWTYTTALSGGTVGHETLLTNSEVDPLGNKVTRYFSVCVNNCSHPDGPYEYGLPVARDSGGDGTGRFLSTEVYDASNVKLRTTYARFEHDTPAASSTVEDRSRLNQRLASTRMVFHDDVAGTYADETLSMFDGLGHYRRKDLSGNFPGSNARSTHVEYNSSTGVYGQPGYVPWPVGSPWVLNTHLFAWEQENGKVQYRISCYEAATGFLQRHRILKNSGGAEHANDLLQVFQRDTAGNVTTESHYGGDTQSLAANACGMALPANPVYQYTHIYSGGVRARTSVTVGTTLNTVDLTIDASTGLTSASRDTAGLQTNFSYDALGRMVTIDPPDDLLTTYTYCTATSTSACPAGVRSQVVVARKASVGGAETTATRVRFDDWGRKISEEERMPPAGNFSEKTFAYNALGWPTYVSEKGAPGSGTSYQNFDAFGRPRTIRPPDGGSHDITLSYQGERQVSRTYKVATGVGSETNATTTEVFDRHGRLYEVTEPNNVKTRYEYDAGNRLSKVCQGATGAGTATCGQTRLYNYDHRGFLLSEQHPEKGASGNGTISYFNYDAGGNPGRKVDGPNDLTFTYDKAERLTQVRETGGAQRVLKSFTYSTLNFTDAFGVDYRKGKITSASRFNYIGAPFNATAEVRDTYTYRGTEGRVSEHSRQLIFNGVNEEKFSTTYSYDGLGNFASIGYPDCVVGDCPASDTPRTVNYNYSYGRLVSIPNYTGTAGGVSQITYHSNGLIHQIPHVNGVLYTQTKDPNNIARPDTISSSKNGSVLWTEGPYNYDGAGNVKMVGMQPYQYDSLGRLSQGTTAGVSQSYTYDNYGNLQSITTNGSLQNTPTSSSTNRLTSGTYDGAGNLTSWNGNTYQYDAFNQLARFTSGGEDWVYMYGADEERFWMFRTAGGGSVWTLRDLAGMVLRQYNAHNSWGDYEDYIYRGPVLLANFRSNGQQRHFDTDHLGTVRLITNVAGNTLTYHGYHPYGREITSIGEADRMKFTGHERDLGSLLGDGDDLDYMHARHYSPVHGRFHSTDLLPARPWAPQSWNRYSYVEGGPMTFFDPDGLGKIGAARKVVGTVIELVHGKPKVIWKAYDEEDLLQAYENMEDIRGRTQRTSRSVTRDAGGGATPIGEIHNGKGYMFHYHDRFRNFKHAFKTIAAWGTLSHWAAGRGEALEIGAELVDIVNPLALGQDFVELYELFIVNETENGPEATLVDGVQVTAPGYVPLDPFITAIDANSFHTGNFGSMHDLFLQGSVCIEGICVY